MIWNLKKDVKRLGEKLDDMSKLYDKGGTAQETLKESSGGHGRNVKREREFGTHIGRFGYWL